MLNITFRYAAKVEKNIEVFRKVLPTQLKFKLSFLFKVLLCFYVSHSHHGWTSPIL